MKKKIIKKLILNKEDIMNLSSEDAGTIRGGNLAPTFVDPEHGGYCTNTCDAETVGYEKCTNACTGACPSVHGGGACDGSIWIINCTVIGACHSQGANCTYGECTGLCPTTYNDATCTCTPATCGC